MIALLALAAALPTPAQAQDIRCVAAIAIVAGEQKRGAGWSDVDDVQSDGPDYAALIGEEVMKTTGATREDVRAQMIAAVAAIQKAKALPRDEVTRCIAAMKKRLPPAPEPSLPRCAAIMRLSYEAVKARDGLTKDAKDLATLAAVLLSRAQEQALAEGRTLAEAEVLIGLERELAAKAKGAPEAELRACTTLAAPKGAK